MGLLAELPEWGPEPVRPEDRVLGPLDLFVLWSSLGVGLLVLLAGALLPGLLGLGLPQVLLVALLGSFIGSLLLALAGTMGGRHGVPTMVGLRPLLGRGGSYVPTALNVLQLFGWTSFELMIMAQAASVASGGFLGSATPFLFLPFFAAWCTLLALGGPLVVVRKYLERIAIWLVYGSTAWITYQAARAWTLGGLAFAWNPDAPLLLALDLVIAMPISWWPLVNDYNRFARSPRAAFGGTLAGYVVANTWFYALGAALALLAPTGDVIAGIVLLSLGLLALLPILVDETDNAFANIYSTAVSLQNAFPRRRQRPLVLLVAAAGTGLAAYLLLLGPAAAGVYEAFLLLIGGLFVPLLGVLLADYFLLRRGRYPLEEFFPPAPTARPWAFVPWGLGAVAYFLLAIPGLLPLPWLGASLPGFGIAAGAHLALARFAGWFRSRRAPLPVPP